MKLKIIFSVLIFLLLFSTSFSKEINITSDKLIVDRENKISIFSGNVHVHDKDMKIWAEQLTVKFNYDEDEIEEIIAEKKVKIVRENITATGKIGFYYPLSNQIKLQESVEVIENNNLVKCDELVLDIENSISIMKSSSENRVEAIIVN